MEESRFSLSLPLLSLSLQPQAAIHCDPGGPPSAESSRGANAFPLRGCGAQSHRSHRPGSAADSDVTFISTHRDGTFIEKSPLCFYKGKGPPVVFKLQHRVCLFFFFLPKNGFILSIKLVYMPVSVCMISGLSLKQVQTPVCSFENM